MIGVILILASTLAYNGSAVLLAAEARRQEEGKVLFVAVGKRFRGASAILLNLLGWALEISALTLIPLTLARILNAAGLAFLLGLTRWTLKEPLGRRDILGVAFVGFGIIAVGFAPPHRGSFNPVVWEWVLLFAILGPGVLLPVVPKLLRKPVGPLLGATAGGLAYALSGILNKEVADVFRAASIVSIVLVVGVIAGLGFWGFVVELDALKSGRASVVVPIVMALHTVVPIVVAPLLFGEVWPASIFLRALLGGGIALTILGAVVLSSSPRVAVVRGAA